MVHITNSSNPKLNTDNLYNSNNIYRQKQLNSNNTNAITNRNLANLEYGFEKQGKMRAIVIKNISAPLQIKIHCDTLRFTSSCEKSGAMKFYFQPDWNKHKVFVTDRGLIVKTISLDPCVPKATFVKNRKRKILIENLKNPESIKLASTNKMNWSLQPCQEKDTFILSLYPHGNKHSVKIFVADSENNITLIKNGSFKFEPLKPGQKMDNFQKNWSDQRQSYYPPPYFDRYAFGYYPQNYHSLYRPNDEFYCPRY
ncbi:hypothetical protein MHBO_000131 [Bonamia ostreae]|uniref:Uncharacterized protein n=1 Tax=Bonamia ostreae TaxID=126728 RepID=A0ABV2AF81_9EUKA